MAGSIVINNTFATQAGPIPLSQLDSNFSQLTTAVNNAATFSNYAADSGTANSYAIAFSSPTTVSYTAGLTLQFLAGNTNTGASTLNVNGLGAQSIVGPTGSALTAGAIVAGTVISVVYNGTAFQLVGLTNNSSSLTSPVTISAPSSGNVALTVNGVTGTHSTKIADSATNLFNAGFLETPINTQTTNYTAVLSDSGKSIYYASAGAVNMTIPANSSVAYPTGTVLTFINDASAAVAMSILITTDTLVLAGAGTTGTRTLARYGVATAVKVASTKWYISGTNLT
jgi:hypothetical protein